MSNRKTATIFIHVWAFLIQNALAQIVHHDTKISVKVIGENQAPISNALVRIAFGQERQLGKAIQIEGLSDSSGLFTVQHVSDGHVFWSAQKSGHYSSTGYEYLFNNDLIEAGQWQPWNTVFNVVLYKIIHPVPMYVKKVDAEIPKKQEPVGFDLEKGDWVSPYGSGTVSDIIFFLTHNVTDKDNYESKLIITFSNKGDGIQETTITAQYGSQLKFPHQAPEAGYSDTIIIEQGKKNDISFGQKYSMDRAYYVRTRTIMDEDGNILSAKYGKVGDSILLSGIAKENVRIKFIYYLNPDGTRNLEYSGENLFKGDGRLYPP